jgi:hypothetical protein
MENITQIINKALEEEDDAYSKRNPTRVNRYIYKNIYKNVLNKFTDDTDISVKRVLLHNYVLNLDKTRIKTPEEYYNELTNSPIYIPKGSIGYVAPEFFTTKSKIDAKTQRKNELYRTYQTDEHIIAPINPLYVDTQDECNFDINTPLHKLISLTYLKHMYNRPLLDSCRSLIKFKIIYENEILNDKDRLFLSKIDNYLYRIYLEKHNLAAKNVKRMKTKARRNKKTQKKKIY